MEPECNASNMKSMPNMAPLELKKKKKKKKKAKKKKKKKKHTNMVWSLTGYM